MRKVGHFIDSDDPGGAETLVVEICSRLDKNSFSPVVLHFGNKWLEQKCRESGIPMVLVPGFSYYKSFKTLPVFSVIFSKFLRDNGVDLVHSHLFGSITGACLPTAISRIPHIGTIHDTYTIEEKKNRVHLLRAASRLGTRLVTVSGKMKERLEELGSFKGDVLRVIRNGVDLARYGERQSEGIRERLGIGQSDFVLACVGRLVELKGHNILIEAFKLLKPRRPLRLLIIGDGPDRKRYEELAARLGLGGTVQFLGQRDDVPALLGASDCFALASSTEGLSCSIVEAMAAGLPVVATDVGGNPELVQDGFSGYLVQYGDAATLAERLQSLIDDEAKRKTFGANSLEIAGNYSMDEMMKEYTTNYREMLGERQ